MYARIPELIFQLKYYEIIEDPHSKRIYAFSTLVVELHNSFGYTGRYLKSITESSGGAVTNVTDPPTTVYVLGGTINPFTITNMLC